MSWTETPRTPTSLAKAVASGSVNVVSTNRNLALVTAKAACSWLVNAGPTDAPAGKAAARARPALIAPTAAMRWMYLIMVNPPVRNGGRGDRRPQEPEIRHEPPHVCGAARIRPLPRVVSPIASCALRGCLAKRRRQAGGFGLA